MLRKGPILLQRDEMDGGATCLAMIANHYGHQLDRDKLRKLCDLGHSGTTLLGISIGLDRMSDIHGEADEETSDQTITHYSEESPKGYTIVIKDLSFKYDLNSPRRPSLISISPYPMAR